MTRAAVSGLSGAEYLALDAGSIAQSARVLRDHAGQVSDDGAQVTSGWRQLGEVYQSQVSPALVHAMEPVAPAAAGLSEGLTAVARALDEYALEVDALTTRHTSVAVDVAALERAITADADWRGDSRLVARQQQLQQSVGSLSRDFAEARDRCVSAIEAAATPAVHAAGPASGQASTPGTGDSGLAGAPWDPRHLFLTASFDSMTPTQVDAWWTSLSPAAQATYLASQPRLVGGLDGIPAAVRDTANRSRLDRELARLTAERDALSYFQRNVSERVLSDRLNERIDAIASVRSVLVRSDRLLLHLDVTGPEVLAAVAVGDPDHADHVGVIVGGTGTNVEDGLDKMDTSAELLRERAETVGDHDDGQVSVIAWLGYEAPPSLPEAADPRFARGGQDALRQFSQGLDAARPTGSPGAMLTVGGHSYAALTVTLASQHPGSQVDNVVTYGAPGIAKTLPDDIDRYWMTNSDDPIRHVVRSGWYKFQPSVDEGWSELGTHSVEMDADDLAAGEGHDYLEDMSTTQHNLAAVIAGRPDMMVLYEDR